MSFHKSGSATIKVVIGIILSLILGGIVIYSISTTIGLSTNLALNKIRKIIIQEHKYENSRNPVWNGNNDYCDELRGEGSKNNPYRITTLSEFISFANSVDNGNDYLGEYVSLETDIYLNKGEFSEKTWKKWNPIGNINIGVFFNGIFNGNNHTVFGIYTDNIDSGGLFEVIGGIDESKTVVKNLNIESSYIGAYSDCGALASYIVNSDIHNVNIKNIYLNSMTTGYYSAYAIDVSFLNCIYSNIFGSDVLVAMSHNTTFS